MMKSAGIIITIWVSLLYGKMKILCIVKFKMVSSERHKCFKRCYISGQFILFQFIYSNLIYSNLFLKQKSIQFQDYIYIYIYIL